MARRLWLRLRLVLLTIVQAENQLLWFALLRIVVAVCFSIFKCLRAQLAAIESWLACVARGVDIDDGGFLTVIYRCESESRIGVRGIVNLIALGKGKLQITVSRHQLSRHLLPTPSEHGLLLVEQPWRLV